MAHADKLIAKSQPTIKERVRVLFNIARIAASFLVLPLAHIKFVIPGSKDQAVVTSYLYLPIASNIIRELRHGQLIAQHLFRDARGGNWTATVHNDYPERTISVDGFPARFVEIPNSADLSEAEALRKGLGAGLFTR